MIPIKFISLHLIRQSRNIDAFILKAKIAFEGRRFQSILTFPEEELPKIFQPNIIPKTKSMKGKLFLKPKDLTDHIKIYWQQLTVAEISKKRRELPIPIPR